MIGVMSTARVGGVLAGGAAAALTIGAAAQGDESGRSPVRRAAIPLSAAALGVAALALGRGRTGAAGTMLRAGGAGLAIGATGAALLGLRAAMRPPSGAASGPATPAPTPSPAPAEPSPTSPAPAPSPRPAPAPTPPPAPAPAATPAPAPPRTEPATPSAPAEPAPTQPGAPEPSVPSEPAPAPVKLLKVGSSGPDVAALQTRLGELGYAVDSGGTYTHVTRDAVMAFQKINGLDRDGVAGPQTLGALDDPREPELGPGAPDRVDVDLSTQTLVVVRGGKVDYIVNATSGDPNHPDGQGIATPKGTFSVERKIAGTRHAPLGELYYPSYFRGGVAVHGSNSVVAERASHGCVRIPRWIEQRVFEDMPVGAQVVVHD